MNKNKIEEVENEVPEIKVVIKNEIIKNEEAKSEEKPEAKNEAKTPAERQRERRERLTSQLGEEEFKK